LFDAIVCDDGYLLKKADLTCVACKDASNNGKMIGVG